MVSETELVEYVLGQVSPGRREEIAREASADRELQAQIRQFQALLVEATPESEPSEDLKSRVMGTIQSPAESPARFAGFSKRLIEMFELTQSQVATLLSDVQRYPEAPWVVPSVAGVGALHFTGGPRVAGSECGIVHMRPGTPFPEHGHEGTEWTLILQGEAILNSGDVAHAGDIIVQDEQDRHGFSAGIDEALIFAVMHNGLKLD